MVSFSLIVFFARSPVFLSILTFTKSLRNSEKKKENLEKIEKLKQIASETVDINGIGYYTGGLYLEISFNFIPPVALGLARLGSDL